MIVSLLSGFIPGWPAAFFIAPVPELGGECAAGTDECGQHFGRGQERARIRTDDAVCHKRGCSIAQHDAHEWDIGICCARPISVCPAPISRAAHA